MKGIELNYISSFFDKSFQNEEGKENHSSRYGEKIFLAEGASKSIYKVADFHTGRDVAIAILKSEDPMKALLFKREARICAALQHPHIIPVYEIGVSVEWGSYFTMKLVEGQSLRKILDSEKLHIKEYLEIFQKICDAVAYAHSRGVIHLDLKPENVLISDYGEVLVLDWGLAKILDSDCKDQFIEEFSFDKVERKNLTLNGEIKGTPGYMAPEQCGLKERKRQTADIYSLGIILFEILCGKLPITGSATEMIISTKNGKLDLSKAGMPAGLAAVIDKATSLKPCDRYLTVKDLQKEINHWVLGFSTQAEKAGMLRKASLFFQRHKSFCLLIIVFFIITFSLIYYFINNLRKSEKEAREALTRYQEEKIKKETLGEAAIPKLRENLSQALNERNFNLAKKTIKKILEVNSNPENVKLAEYLQLIDLGKVTKLIKGEAPEGTSLITLLILDQMTTGENRDASSKAFQKLLKWPHVKDCKWLVNIAAALHEEQRLELLRHILKLLENNLWDGRALIAEQALDLCREQSLKNAFEKIIFSNLALHQPVFSSVENQKPASFAVDGDVDSYWSGGSTPGKLTVDLGRVHEIGKINLYLYSDNNRFYQYRILSSVDGGSFEIIDDKSDNEKTSSIVPEVFIFPKRKARYVRVEMIKNSANPGLHIREIEVFRSSEENLALKSKVLEALNVENPELTIDGYQGQLNYSILPRASFILLDLGAMHPISKIKVFLFHNGSRIHYYSILGSVDNNNWQLLTDRSKNREITTIAPHIFRYKNVKFRYLKFLSHHGSELRELEVYEK